MKTNPQRWSSAWPHHLLTAILFLLLASSWVCKGQPGVLRDATTGLSIDAGAKRIIVLIHGWNSDNVSDMYARDPWSSLIDDIKKKLADTDWRLFTYHWEQGGLGANTGPIYDWNLL